MVAVVAVVGTVAVGTVVVGTAAWLTVRSDDHAPVVSTPASGAVPGADRDGFLELDARCNAKSRAVLIARTPDTAFVVCQGPGADHFYYRAARTSDGAALDIDDVAPVDGGYDVRNPIGGARYEIRDATLTTVVDGRVTATEPITHYSDG